MTKLNTIQNTLRVKSLASSACHCGRVKTKGLEASIVANTKELKKGGEKMGIFSNLFKTNTPRENNTDPFMDAVVSMTSEDTSLYVGAGALKNSDIFSAIRKIAGDIADTSITYTDASTQGKRVERLLNRAPNENSNAWSFWFAIMCSCLLNGNSFAKVEHNPTGQVTGLTYLPNDEVTVQTDTATGKLTYKFNGETFTSDNVLHFKVFTQDGQTGVSPIYALQNQISVQSAKNNLIKHFFGNGSLGSSILTIHGTDIDSTAKNRVREKFLQANQNNNGTIVLDDNTDFKNLPIDKSVLETANSVDYTTREVAAAFGLPVEVLGIENEHSNDEQSMLNYLQSTLVYYFKCITSELDAKIASQNNNFMFDTSSFFTADPTVSFKMYENAVANSLLTPNEARIKLGLKPLEGGNSLVEGISKK